MLLPLIPSVGRALTAQPADSDCCAYCGGAAGKWAAVGACVLCQPVLQLDRPQIDDEAALAWIPEITQAALNRIMRELHCRLHVSSGGSNADRGPHYVSRTIKGRVGAAAEALGTDRPSELAQALAIVSPAAYADRHRRLASVRIVSTGRFFDDGQDVYPQVLDEWCKPETEGAP